MKGLTRSLRTRYIHPCKQCIVGKHNCEGTPFEEWRDHHIEWHKEKGKRLDTTNGLMVKCPTCVELAQKEVDFLKSLLDKLPQERKFEVGDLVTCNNWPEYGVCTVAKARIRTTGEFLGWNLIRGDNKESTGWIREKNLTLFKFKVGDIVSHEGRKYKVEPNNYEKVNNPIYKLSYSNKFAYLNGSQLQPSELETGDFIYMTDWKQYGMIVGFENGHPLIVSENYDTYGLRSSASYPLRKLIPAHQCPFCKKGDEDA